MIVTPTLIEKQTEKPRDWLRGKSLPVLRIATRKRGGRTTTKR